MRLIDADNLVPDICDAEIEYGTKPVHFSANAIDLAPTVDAVPVVRCRECRAAWISAFRPDRLFCQEHGRYVDTDGYCYLAEPLLNCYQKKEGADNDT